VTRKVAKTRPNRTIAQEVVAKDAPEAWRRHIWRISILWLVVFAAYSNCFSAGLIFDNAKIILEDSRIHEATWNNVRVVVGGQYWPNISTSGLYRPLTSLSYLLNYSVLGNGADPEGYHWVNLLLHGLNMCLVYALGVMVLRSLAQAMTLTLLWAVHPLLTESVTNIVGRADLLAAFGVLAGLLCYIRFLSIDGRQRFGWLAAMIGAQGIGLFSKESAVVLPGIMLIYDLIWPERATVRKRTFPYVALMLLAGVFFYIRHRLQLHMVINFLENPLIAATFWTGRLTATKVIGAFLWKFAWPSRLSADYSYAAIPLFGWHLDSWEDAKAIASLALCIGALVLCGAVWRNHRPLVFFIGVFFVALLPASNLVVLIGSIMAERFMYLPSVGLAGCVVCTSFWLIQVLGVTKWFPPDRAILTLASLVTLALAVRTHARNLDWQDDIRLWSSTVTAYPQNARAHYNLGTALLTTRGPVPEAILELETAASLAPDELWEAHYNLGNVFIRMQSRLPDAIREYRATLRTKPDFAEAHTNLGLALEKSNQLPGAVAELEIALRYQPNDAKAHYDLGNVFFRMSTRMPDAIHEWETAAQIEPDLAEAHYNLGIVLSSQPDRLPEAISQLETTIRIQPGNADARYNLARALLRVPGRESEAIAEFEAATRIAPNPREQEKFDKLRAVVGNHRSSPR
jgi:protein O-mannosyl-transferase